VTAVSEADAHRISAFKRCDGALLRRFGSLGSGDDQQLHPSGVCFVTGHRCVAVAEYINHRVSMFSVEGQFVRHVTAAQ
jgi:hypothetical protein